MAFLRKVIFFQLCITLSTLSPSLHADESGKPLKIYLLAGQSNMSGYGNLRTLDYMKKDPVSVPILHEILNEKGKPRIIDDVWISEPHKSGQLTTGFGANRGGPKIGPELTFGIYMKKQVKQPILIIKTSWGSTSLHTDWRPPSAGDFAFSQEFLDEAKEKKQDLEKIKKEKAEKSGKNYRMMMEHVNKVLADIKQVYPDYNEKNGYELSGFVWFQGVHDLIDKATYPKAGKDLNAHSEHARLLACLIRDVRKDLKAPKMKVVIGEIGLNGDLTVKPNDMFVPLLKSLRAAQKAPTTMEEFKGNVFSVDTSIYWEPELEKLQARWDEYKKHVRPIERDKSISGEEKEKRITEARRKVYTDKEWKMITTGTSHAGYHYMGCAKIYARIGKAFAEAMAILESGK